MTQEGLHRLSRQSSAIFPRPPQNGPELVTTWEILVGNYSNKIKIIKNILKIW